MGWDVGVDGIEKQGGHWVGHRSDEGVENEGGYEEHHRRMKQKNEACIWDRHIRLRE